MIVIEAVSKRIQTLMTEKNLTPYSVCKKATVDLSTIYNITNGRQKTISFNVLLLLCEGLGVTIQEFLNDPLFEKSILDID